MRLVNRSLSLLILIAAMAACTSSRQGMSAKKGVNGSWTLQTINIEGITERFSPNIFNEANLNCFIGSNWDFSMNDSTGSYKLVGGTTGCSTLQRNIRWSIIESKDATKEFQFKRLDDKNNTMDDSNGFKLSVTMLDKNSMQLKSVITFEEKPGNIVYNFVKK
ncbi:MAG: hypothetical protein ABIQ31_07060 [Ferruginibacter sp.]